MSKLKEKLQAFINKMKGIKHIEIYLAVGLALIVALIYFSSLGASSSNKKNGSSTNEDNLNLKFTSSQEYVCYLENKLENVITNVKGVGEADIIITLEKGFEYIYVTEEETNTTTNGSVITKVSVVMIDGQPVLKDEIYPLIKGIVVVADGVGDIDVKMNVLSLIQTVIDVDNSKINILESD